MSIYSLHEVFNSTDHYKLFLLPFQKEKKDQVIESLVSKKIKVLDLGKKIAQFINSLEDYKYLNIDVVDHSQKLMDQHKTKTKGNDVVAITNIGILLEPALEINSAKLLKEYSKSTSLIIIWEHEVHNSQKLTWKTQKTKYFLDFSDINLKILQDEV
jgi:hypothetical protein